MKYIILSALLLAGCSEPEPFITPVDLYRLELFSAGKSMGVFQSTEIRCYRDYIAFTGENGRLTFWSGEFLAEKLPK